MITMQTVAPSIKPHERSTMLQKFLVSESSNSGKRWESTVRPRPAAAPVAISTANTCSVQGHSFGIFVSRPGLILATLFVTSVLRKRIEFKSEA